MKISNITKKQFKIECSRNELIVFSNALNNIPQAVSEEEYTSLIGASKSDTTKLMYQFVDILSREN